MSTQTEQWRRWLEDPAVIRDDSESVAAGRRGIAARSRGARGPASSSGNPSARRRIVGVALLAGVIGSALAVVAVTGGHQDGRAPAHPYAIATPAASATTTPAGPPPFCSPGNVGGTIVTNTAGDRASGPGVIAAYEHAFFAARDPRAALDVTDRGPGLPAEPQLAQGIAAVPVGAPWCVSITDLGGGLYETAVRHLPGQGQPPVLWLLTITVAEQGGVHTIVRIEDKAG